MGKSIFRYRKVTDYSINELLYDEIVGTTNDLMNDPYDCKFYYNEDELTDYLIKRKTLVESFLEKNKYKNFKDEKFLVNWYAEQVMERIVSKSFYTVCFAEKNDKEIMWSHYADNGKGFVIEYDIDILKNELRHSALGLESFRRRTVGVFKVRYPKLRSDMTDFMKNTFIVAGNNQNLDYNFNDIPTYRFMIGMTKRIVTEKNNDWSYEKEYRLIWPNTKRDEEKNLLSGHEVILSGIKPTAIYIGENCSKKDKIVLYSIARAKDIKLYQMSSINKIKEYKLMIQEISDRERDSVIDRNLFDRYDEIRWALNNMKDYLRDMDNKDKLSKNKEEL